MRYPVVKRFKDRITGVSYRPSDAYETEDEARASELVGRGFIAGPAKRAAKKAEPKVDKPKVEAKAEED